MTPKMADPNPNEAKRRWFEPASAILFAASRVLIFPVTKLAL